jgi:Uma2 family endonuclease
LSLERSAEQKHEFYAGEIFAMAGASKEHVRISGNLYFHLRLQLQGKPCEPFNSDMRVKVSASGLYT